MTGFVSPVTGLIPNPAKGISDGCQAVAVPCSAGWQAGPAIDAHSLKLFPNSQKSTSFLDKTGNMLHNLYVIKHYVRLYQWMKPGTRIKSGTLYVTIHFGEIVRFVQTEESG